MAKNDTWPAASERLTAQLLPANVGNQHATFENGDWEKRVSPTPGGAYNCSEPCQRSFIVEEWFLYEERSFMLGPRQEGPRQNVGDPERAMAEIVRRRRTSRVSRACAALGKSRGCRSTRPS